VLPLIGLTLMVLMGAGGIGVDVGYLESRQQAQQTATDAAAAGGAEALLRAGCPNQTTARAAAYGDASNNGFTNGSNGVTVTANNPPASGPFAGNSCAVFVTIQTSQVATFFTRLFGYSNGATESTQAAAIVSGSGTACIYLLSPTVQSDITNAHINAPSCGIVINDSANMSNSTIDMNSITYAGPAPNVSGATFPEAAPLPALPVADPCSRIPSCSYLTNNPPSTAGCGGGGTYTTSVSPGCYNKMTLNGTVTMQTGVYVINGQFHLNNATVTSATGGVTIYMTSNVQDTNFSSSSLNLSAMTSGSTAGVLMYRVPAQSSALDFSTCMCNLGGLLYFPTTQVNYSNTGSQYSVLVFGSANLSTSHGVDLGPPPVGQSLINQAVVAE
jgi:hypothetical protein